MKAKAVLCYANILMLILSGCASLQNESYTQFNFEKQNRAPASFSIKPVLAGDSRLEPLYLRTQADYYYSMAEAYSFDGQNEKAIESFKMVLAFDENAAAVHQRLASEYLKLGLLNESLEQAEIASQKDPKNIESKILLGGLYSSMKLFAKAEKLYSEVLKLDPENQEVPFYIGALFSEQKKYDQAVKYFESLAKKSKDVQGTRHLSQYYIGRIRQEQASAENIKRQDYYLQLAEIAYQKAIEFKPDYVDATIALGTLYQRSNRNDKAEKVFKTYQAAQPVSPKVSELLAQIYLQKEDYPMALKELLALEDMVDDALDVKLRIALVNIEIKKYEVAALKLEEILAIAPESDKARFYLGAVYEESKEYDKASFHFGKIPSGSSYFEDASIHAAFIKHGEGSKGEAIQILQAAVKEKPEAVHLYTTLASFLDDAQKTVAGVAILKKAVELFPKDVSIHFFLGTLTDKLGDTEVALSHMKRVVELDPEHAQGLNYLAFTWAEKGINLAEAEVMARRAVELEPKEGYILDTLGWILFKTNRLNESIQYLEAAHKSQPKVSLIAEHLADAYSRKALVDKARVMYMKAAELESDNSKVNEIQSKISGLESVGSSQRMPASQP